MKIYVFNKTKDVADCGNAKHIYLPNTLKDCKICGVVVVDESENITYQHTQLKKCADCAVVQALGVGGKYV